MATVHRRCCCGCKCSYIRVVLAGWTPSDFNGTFDVPAAAAGMLPTGEPWGCTAGTASTSYNYDIPSTTRRIVFLNVSFGSTSGQRVYLRDQSGLNTTQVFSANWTTNTSECCRYFPLGAWAGRVFVSGPTGGTFTVVGCFDADGNQLDI